MPIYEYNCTACGKRSSIFYRTLSDVESSPACPHCGQHHLQRRMSRVFARRTSISSDNPMRGPDFEHDGVPFYGGDPSMLDGSDVDDYGADTADGDVASFAREALAMSSMMGEPLDADLDTALRHIERGADPDDVLGELDERSVPADPSDDIS